MGSGCSCRKDDTHHDTKAHGRENMDNPATGDYDSGEDNSLESEDSYMKNHLQGHDDISKTPDIMATENTSDTDSDINTFGRTNNDRGDDRDDDASATPQAQPEPPARIASITNDFDKIVARIAAKKAKEAESSSPTATQQDEMSYTQGVDKEDAEMMRQAMSFIENTSGSSRNLNNNSSTSSGIRKPAMYKTKQDIDKIRLFQFRRISDVMQVGNMCEDENLNVDDYNYDGADEYEDKDRDMIRIMPLEIKDRKYNLKSYKSCFVAHEFVLWLIEHNYVDSWQNGIYFANKMIQLKLIGHVTKQSKFSLRLDDKNVILLDTNGHEITINELRELNIQIKKLKPKQLIFLQFINENPLPRKTDLPVLVNTLKNYLRVKDRNYRGRTYKQCFISQEFVNFVVKENIAQSKLNGVSIGQFILDEGYIKHVSDNKQFKNGYYFYKFTQKAKQ